MSREFAAYAGPLKWGLWQTVADHLGVVKYTIEATPVGDTVLRCRVKYFNAPGSEVTEEWRDEVVVTTGDIVASVQVSFMGLPEGSAVKGMISP
jgi:hypothetical protein